MTEKQPALEILQRPEVREEIIKHLTSKFSPDVLNEIRRINILHTQAEVEEMKRVYL